MLPRQILRQVRRLQFQARRAVEELLGGEYHSVFRGSGIAFEEVRAYQPGDDVRGIDWNVTARMGQPFVKRYIEDRERTVILALDVSGSLGFGTAARSKHEVAAELAAVLAFSAVTNNDRIGLMQFTDQLEHVLPPRKGSKHVLRLLRDVLFFQPRSRTTSLTRGLDHLNRVLRRRAVVFLFSDFIDRNYEQSFRRTARRHDLIAVRLSDPREEVLPNVGLVEIEDAESGQRLLVDTSNAAMRAAYADQAAQRREQLNRLARAARVDLLEVATDGQHLEALLRFFRRRRQKTRRR